MDLKKIIKFLFIFYNKLLALFIKINPKKFKFKCR